MTAKTLNVLVTGATGFLGKAILNAFALNENINLIAACRNKQNLPESFKGDVRQGDLRDSTYLKTMVKDIDVICHAGTWAAMWGHAKQEQQNFYQPNIELIEYAIEAGVKRFLMAGTIAIAKKNNKASVYDDFSETAKTGFWPHLDCLIDIDNYMKKMHTVACKWSTCDLGILLVQVISLALFRYWYLD